MAFVIEKGYDLPGERNKYPFDQMKVSDSFSLGNSARDARNCNSALQYYKRKNPSKNFTVRHVGGNVWRCWRTK